MIILASQSPRRKEILAEILQDVPFKCCPSSFDERSIEDNNCYQLCIREALAKALDISHLNRDDYVIASDTMVLYHNHELGKPKDRKEALEMLRTLSGNKHTVITAYCILKGNSVLKERVVSASLFIEKMADLEIEEYIDTGSPFDKAGGYGIQDKDFINARILSGSIYTIMGLPKDELTADLEELGLI